MNFPDWLDQKRGRLQQVANKFHVTKSAVSQWRSNGIPKAYMLTLRAFTKGQVSLEEMLEAKDAA